MRKHLQKIKSFVIARKILSVFILLVILLLGYLTYKKITSTAGDTRYVLAKVEKGTIISSVSGTGQVSALNQIEVKTRASGDIVSILVKDGEKVWQGMLLVKIDSKEADKAVRDAEVNLASAKIVLEKLKIQKSVENMTADLAKAYDDGFNTVSNVYLDLPDIMTGLSEMFFKSNPGSGQWNVDWYEGQVASADHEKAILYKKNFIDAYGVAKKFYDMSFENYKGTSRSSDNSTIESLILKTYETTKLISDAVKNANNYVDFVNDSIQRNNFDTPKIISTHKTSLGIFTTKTNTHLLNLLAIKTSIKSFKDAFPNTDLDLQSSMLTVKQKENTLQDAKDKLADYFVRAPFDGTLAKINIKKFDSITAGVSVATLITKKVLAEISLNEIDVAKIKIGQKADLTFDAIASLNISGVVEEIDSIGTVSQGVVTYNVKISFDTEDERIKTGMSVSAVIITDKKENVFLVPNSALKFKKDGNYVEMFQMQLLKSNDGLPGSISKVSPDKIPVTAGLANDSKTEIISGLKEGEEIIVRTILPSASKNTAPSIFGSPAGGGNKNNSGGNNLKK